MNGIAGSRVIVLDDKADEALPIIHAFSKVAIPVTYFDGKNVGLPRVRDRLIGVRLAILDMDLGEGGNVNTLASTVVQRLSKILSPNNGPYAILAWTNHPELRDKVEEYIFKHPTLPKPMFTEMLTKAECKSGKNFVLTKVSEKLGERLREVGALEFLQAWEGSCFGAATNVSNTIASLALDSTATDLAAWRKGSQREMWRLVRALATAAAEQNLSAGNCISAAYTAMNPLHADRLDAGLGALCGLVSHHAAEIYGTTGEPSLDNRARINSMLHLNIAPDAAFAPGSMYAFTGKRVPKWVRSFDEILDGFVQNARNPAARTTNIATVAAASTRVAVEISPACDFAQNKLQVARLICGALVKQTEMHFINEKAFRVLGPLFMERNVATPGVYSLCLSYLQNLSLPIEVVKKLKSFARLRDQALADVQAWASYQAARQGTIMLR